MKYLVKITKYTTKTFITFTVQEIESWNFVCPNILKRCALRPNFSHFGWEMTKISTVPVQHNCPTFSIGYWGYCKWINSITFWNEFLNAIKTSHCTVQVTFFIFSVFFLRILYCSFRIFLPSFFFAFIAAVLPLASSFLIHSSRVGEKMQMRSSCLLRYQLSLKLFCNPMNNCTSSQYGPWQYGC